MFPYVYLDSNFVLPTFYYLTSIIHFSPEKTKKEAVGLGAHHLRGRRNATRALIYINIIS